MFFCCSGEDTGGNAVVVVEPTSVSAVPDEVRVDDTADDRSPTVQAEAQEEDETAKKRRADEEAAAREAAEARSKKELEDEARRKEVADEAAAREAAAKEALKEVVGLPLTFRDASGAKTYTVNFKTKPLGMDFNQNAKPVKVTKAFGAAKRLGVSEGSDLIDIAGTDVEQLDFGQMLEVLKERIAPLTPDGLVINFRDQGQRQRTIVFPTKPLGMDFDHGRKPIRIKNVLGAAQSLGVEASWELMTIAGTDVAQMDFEKMLELLRGQIELLPTKD